MAGSRLSSLLRTPALDGMKRERTAQRVLATLLLLVALSLVIRRAVAQAYVNMGMKEVSRVSLSPVLSGGGEDQSSEPHSLPTSASAELKSAAGAFAVALRWWPSDAAALRSLGRVFLASGQPADAAGMFRETIAINASDAISRFSLGSAVESIGLSDEAVLQRALAQAGAYYLQKGEFDVAASVYEQQLALHPEARDNYAGLAAALERIERWKEARQTYESLLYIYPKDVEAQFALAGLLFWHRDHLGADLDEILDQIECTLQLPTTRSQQYWLYVMRGDLNWRKGQFEEAISSFSTAKALDGSLKNAYIGLGVVYILKGDGHRAVLELRIAQAIDHRDPDVISLLGKAEKVQRQ